MKPLPKLRFERVRAMKQRGVVLFFTLVALLVMSLAAVALIRSVDTSTMIAGNLAFKQSATSSGDAGIEAAMNWLAATQLANNTLNVLADSNHPFNIDNLPAGYYATLNSALSLTDGTGIQWDNNDSVLVGTDSSGNTIRYVIQRLCRTPFPVLPETWLSNCLFSDAIQDNSGQNIKLPQEVCQGAGCPAQGQAPQIRVTSRTTGPKNTVSYVQAFVY